jgi:hypothetical protein
MYDGYGGQRDTPLGQGLAILVAIILSCLIVGILTYSVGRDSERDRQRAAEYEEYGERREDAFCAGLPGSLLAKCQIEQEQAAREAYQSQRDLDAQRDMALWALAVFVIGSVTAALTLWALWYVRGTLIATREALRDTGEATKAMLRQNELTELAQRAWLAVEVREFGPVLREPDGRFRVSYTLSVKNTGSRPAIGISDHVVVTRGEDPEALQSRFMSGAVEMLPIRSAALAPGETVGLGGSGHLLDIEDVGPDGLLPNGSVPSFVVGVVYQDVQQLEKVRWTVLNVHYGRAFVEHGPSIRTAKLLVSRKVMT